MLCKFKLIKQELPKLLNCKMMTNFLKHPLLFLLFLEKSHDSFAMYHYTIFCYNSINCHFDQLRGHNFQIIYISKKWLS